MTTFSLLAKDLSSYQKRKYVKKGHIVFRLNQFQYLWNIGGVFFQFTPNVTENNVTTALDFSIIGKQSPSCHPVPNAFLMSLLLEFFKKKMPKSKNNKKKLPLEEETIKTENTESIEAKKEPSEAIEATETDTDEKSTPPQEEQK